MTRPIKVGILGLGQRGLQHLAGLWQLQQEGLVEITALMDAFESNLDPAKIQQYVPGIPADKIKRTQDVNAAIDSGDFEMFHIDIPPNVHKGEVVRAAKAGLHVFVEKPMSLFLDEAIEMQEAIRAAGVLSTVGFQQRFDAAHEAVRDYVQGKNPVMATYTRHAGIETHNVKHTPTETAKGPVNRVWTASRAWSGGTMVEAGIHPLDLWRYWMGDVKWVQAIYMHRPEAEIIDGADNPYTYTALFGFENGAVGDMILSRLRRVFYDETDHKVFLNETILEIDRGVTAYRYEGDYPPAKHPSNEEIRHALPVGERRNTTYEINKAFIQAIGDNRPDLIRSSFDDGMNSLAAVIAANVSDELGGQRVDVNELLTADEYARFRQRPAA